jgi:RyR domain
MQDTQRPIAGSRVSVEEIAKVCHETNRAYCLSQGDASQMPWEQAPEWQKESCIKGVLFHLEHPNSKPSDSHESWLKEKLSTGWKYGPAKDPDKKEHPCCVPFEQLPKDQQAKDFLFITIVRQLVGLQTKVL